MVITSCLNIYSLYMKILMNNRWRNQLLGDNFLSQNRYKVIKLKISYTDSIKKTTKNIKTKTKHKIGKKDIIYNVHFYCFIHSAQNISCHLFSYHILLCTYVFLVRNHGKYWSIYYSACLSDFCYVVLLEEKGKMLTADIIKLEKSVFSLLFSDNLT